MHKMTQKWLHGAYVYPAFVELKSWSDPASTAALYAWPIEVSQTGITMCTGQFSLHCTFLNWVTRDISKKKLSFLCIFTRDITKQPCVHECVCVCVTILLKCTPPHSSWFNKSILIKEDFFVIIIDAIEFF